MERLRMTLNDAIKTAIAKVNQMPWHEKEFYSLYISQTFHYVCHSTRMLALSAGRLNYKDHQKTHLRFLKHLNEEANHEVLARNDLKHLGKNLEDFPELNSTRFFYECQYFKIEHQNPLAIMGYILFLEVLAQEACPPLVKKLTEYYGKKATTFMFVHGEEDPHHVDEALNILQNFSNEDIEIIAQNIEQSAYAFSLILDEIAYNVNINIKKAA